MKTFSLDKIYRQTAIMCRKEMKYKRKKLQVFATIEWLVLLTKKDYQIEEATIKIPAKDTNTIPAIHYYQWISSLLSLIKTHLNEAEIE